ncbi:hypothetical protein AHAS_Ahas16G0253800 [Arachis hypogaea]
MVLLPPAGIVGAVTLFSSPIPSHLFSSRHCRTKEALTRGITVAKVSRSIVISSSAPSLPIPFLPRRHFSSSFAAGKRCCFT